MRTIKSMRTHRIKTAFTLIELLVVVGIISMLIAIFTVGSKKVKVASKGIQQKSVFHALRVGLEMFASDFDGYPASRLRQNKSGQLITGAQHLAEALLGRDERGFEPATKWTPPDDEIYNPAKPADKLYDNTSDSLARRKRPYVELKYGYAVTIYDLWDGMTGGSSVYTSGANAQGAARSPIITDVFNRVQIRLPDGQIVRAGTPILYFKADGSKPFRIDAARQTVFNPNAAQYSQWVYNFDDNLPILQLPWLADKNIAGASKHYQDPDGGNKNAAQVFYEQITQTADPTRNFYKPYNNDTFLLISAGWDGIFGTRDDIVNFD